MWLDRMVCGIKRITHILESTATSEMVRKLPSLAYNNSLCHVKM